MRTKKFWPYSVLGALFGRRGSEIKVLQVLRACSHHTLILQFISSLFACVPQESPQFPGLM